jgi:hypothetical protein
MSGFSAEWLALREPVDATARSGGLVSFVVAGAEHGPHSTVGRLLDLGSGTGSNVRYVSARLASPQNWTLVDDDPRLLARAPAGVTTVCADLNRVLDDDALFQGCGVVTASALLDLVSDAWLQRLVRRCQNAQASVLFALTYDGRIECSPPEPEDADVRRFVNQHQKTDKGFGPALGPDAAIRAVELLKGAQYNTRYESSDWTLGAESPALQRELIDGWLSAASEIAPDRQRQFDDWRRRRVDHVDGGRSRILVGHLDVAGIRRA